MRKIAEIINIIDTEEAWRNHQQDIRVFLSEKLNVSISELRFLRDRPISEEMFNEILRGVGNILEGVPVYRALGYRYFWKDKFFLSEDTLEPRQDTEVLIETCLRYRSDQSIALKILDIGTGTGCILLSLLREYPNALGIGGDIASGALRTAEQNGRALGVSDRVEWIKSHWLDNINGPFDVIVSNPPYISTEDVKSLSKNVRQHDPVRALDGGKDGLQPYRELAAQLLRLMHRQTLVLLEIGYDQGQSVPKIFEAAGYEVVEIIKDYGQNPRCVVFRVAKETV